MIWYFSHGSETSHPLWNILKIFLLCFLKLHHWKMSWVQLLQLSVCSQKCYKLLPVCVCMLICFSHVWLFTTLWTVDYPTPLFVEFPWQEYWSGLPCPPPQDILNPGIKPISLSSPALAGRFFTTEPPWKPLIIVYGIIEMEEN